MKSIYRYIQLGVYIRGYQDPATKSFKREIAEVTEFYVDEDNNAIYNTIFKKSSTGKIIKRAPSKYLIEYLDAQGVTLDANAIVPTENEENAEPTYSSVAEDTSTSEVNEVVSEPANNQTEDSSNQTEEEVLFM